MGIPPAPGQSAGEPEQGRDDSWSHHSVPGLVVDTWSRIAEGRCQGAITQ